MIISFLISSVLLTVSTGDPILDWLANNASAVGVLAYVIVALQRGWLVPGKVHDRTVADLDKAMNLVYSQAEATQRALDVAEKKVS